MIQNRHLMPHICTSEMTKAPGEHPVKCHKSSRRWGVTKGEVTSSCCPEQAFSHDVALPLTDTHPLGLLECSVWGQEHLHETFLREPLCAQADRASLLGHKWVSVCSHFLISLGTQSPRLLPLGLTASVSDRAAKADVTSWW